MAVKTANTYTVDELKEKCQHALADPKLVEIVKTAPLNNSGKVNLSWVYREAEKYVHGETRDLQKTKELAVATRFLAMLRRHHEEEFEKLAAQEKQPKPEARPAETKKQLSGMEFELPWNIEMISRVRPVVMGSPDIRMALRFHGIAGFEEFLGKMLDALIQCDFSHFRYDQAIIDKITQFLEEKSGLKIRICGNCEHHRYNYGWFCFYETPYREKETGGNQLGHCSHWTLKKIPEKPSSA